MNQAITNLAHAIREGAKLREGVTGTMFLTSHTECYGSCALGAAYEHLAGEWVDMEDLYDSDLLPTIIERTGVGLDVYAQHPAIDGSPFLSRERFYDRHLVWNVERISEDIVTAKVYDIIVDLNDNVLWSRERIADWLDSLAEK